MSILGIGVDLIEINRVEKAVLRIGDRFAKRILSINEWNQYQQHNQPIRFLAKRFVIKEAAMKAFGTGIQNGITFSQFEVFNDYLGKPKLRLTAAAAIHAQNIGITNIHVTLADEHHYAYATVLIEGEGVS